MENRAKSVSTKMTGPILEIQNLSVVFHTGEGTIDALKDLTLSVGRGEILAVAGESGSGKSVLCKTIIGLLPPVADITSGSILADGTELTGMTERNLCRVRGADISMVFQDPLTSLDPSCTVGAQIGEAVRIGHRDMSSAEVRNRVISLMEAVGIDRAGERFSSYPWMLSGGMRQRCVLAMALAGDPKFLIADEPTTALDVTVQMEILDLLLSLRESMGLSILFISHDLSVIARIADRVAVLQGGRLVETGSAEEVLLDPKHPYTKKLLRALPSYAPYIPAQNGGHEDSGRPVVSRAEARQEPRQEPVDVHRPMGASVTESQPLLQVTGLSHRFRLGRAGLLTALDNVTFHIRAGEVYALVGESGSGKSTLARCILGMLRPSGGSISFDGIPIAGEGYRRSERSGVSAGSRPGRKIASEKRQRLAREISFISQDPGSALDPKMRVRQLIAEPLQIHRICSSRQELDMRISSMLREVRLDEGLLDRFPDELSGGQKQRVSIARAFITNPKLLIADEPLVSLDVSIQAQILDLFSELRRNHNTAMLFISHDLSTVRKISDRVGVMYRGRLVEQADCNVLFSAPAHPYTRALLSAIPIPDPRREKARQIVRYTPEEVIR